MILDYFTNLLHYKMAVIPTEIMEYNRNFISYSKVKITVLMSGSSVFSCNMTVVSDYYIGFIVFFFTYMTFLCFLKFVLIIFWGVWKTRIANSE